MSLDGTAREMDPAEAEKGLERHGRELGSHFVDRGIWPKVRGLLRVTVDWLVQPHPHAYGARHPMGDTGIEMASIEKVLRRLGKAEKKKREKGQGDRRISVPVGSSIEMAPQTVGAHIRFTASATVNNASAPGSHTGSTTGSTTGTTTANDSGRSTPGIVKKELGCGIEAYELRKQLQEWKRKIERDSEEARRLQAKVELAEGRSMILMSIYAFMVYGAPTYRIEEFTIKLFKTLGVEGRVNFTYGCTEISFVNPAEPTDPFVRSTYTTLVKTQGLDIGACEVAFRIYRQVTHDKVSVKEAADELNALLNGKPTYPAKILVPCYGVAAALTAVWAFGGWWLDMAPAFVFGTMVGFLQIVVSTRNPLYSNVLEVTSAFLTGFLARVLAAVGDQKYFCYSAVAQSSVAVILPGYIVLCASLELQSRSINAGVSRFLYALFYSLLLGCGIGFGQRLWHDLHPGAPAVPGCLRHVPKIWDLLTVPSFAAVLAVIMKNRPGQIPAVVLIAWATHTVYHALAPSGNDAAAYLAAALTLAILSRLWAYVAQRHIAPRSARTALFANTSAFGAMLTSVQLLVPAGLAEHGSLGLTRLVADERGEMFYVLFGAGATMLHVGTWLALGIFLSSIVVHPFGRKTNGILML